MSFVSAGRPPACARATSCFRHRKPPDHGKVTLVAGSLPIVAGAVVVVLLFFAAIIVVVASKRDGGEKHDSSTGWIHAANSQISFANPMCVIVRLRSAAALCAMRQ